MRCATPLAISWSTALRQRVPTAGRLGTRTPARHNLRAECWRSHQRSGTETWINPKGSA